MKIRVAQDRILLENRHQAALASCGTSAQAIHDVILIEAQRLNQSGLTVALDYGAGTGELAAKLVQERLFEEVHAVDLVPYPGAFSDGICWHYADLNEPLNGLETRFDVIFAVEVIEHLENPRALAREWFRLLKPGGWIVCSTPNNETWRSIASLIFRGCYVAFGPLNYPAHITPLLSVDLQRVFKEAGFEAIDFKYINHGALPCLTRRTWQSISGGLLRGQRFSDNVIAIGRKPTNGE